ncbi:hypothetical protein [Streptosporangium sp. KLBMP 9127]|nr:hypothetical protein [Streptosporangium sp. KLBMP 9127]
MSAYRARWRGTDYPANPDPRHDGLWIRLCRAEPAEGFAEVAAGRYVRPVPAAECEAIFHVTTVCEWRGAPCRVHEERAGELLVEYTGGLLPVARALGMERVERGVHRRWVAREEVRDLREHAVPLEA